MGIFFVAAGILMLVFKRWESSRDPCRSDAGQGLLAI